MKYTVENLAAKIAGVLHHEDVYQVGQYTWSEYDEYAEQIAARIIPRRFDREWLTMNIPELIASTLPNLSQEVKNRLVISITRLSHGN